jgi:hypothetical protein
MKFKWRFLAALLSFCLMLAAQPAGVCAAVDDSSSTGLQASSSDDDDDDGIGKEATFGLLLVIVAVLVWIGFKSDLDRFTEDEPESRIADASETEPPPAASLYVDFDSMDAAASSASLHTEGKTELAARVGVEMKF